MNKNKDLRVNIKNCVEFYSRFGFSKMSLPKDAQKQVNS